MDGLILVTLLLNTDLKDLTSLGSLLSFKCVNRGQHNQVKPNSISITICKKKVPSFMHSYLVEPVAQFRACHHQECVHLHLSIVITACISPHL